MQTCDEIYFEILEKNIKAQSKIKIRFPAEEGNMGRNDVRRSGSASDAMLLKFPLTHNSKNFTDRILAIDASA